MQPHYSCVAEEGAGRLPDDKVEASVYEVRGIAHDVRHGRVLGGETVDGDHIASSAAESVGNDASGVTH
jgi:hypothetical protein